MNDHPRPRDLVVLFGMMLIALVVTKLNAQTSSLDPSRLEHPGRPESHRNMDAGRQPVAVYEFLGIQAGMTVADLWAAGGYHTVALSLLLDDHSTVRAVHGFYDTWDEGSLARSLERKVHDMPLTNVGVSNQLADVPDGSVDVALAVRSYHDMGLEYAEMSRQEAVAQIFRMVKSGGVAGIIEAATDLPGFDDENHRMNQSLVIEEFEAGGFILEASSDVLANSEDGRSMWGLSGIQGRNETDRYVLRFRKPAR